MNYSIYDVLTLIGSLGLFLFGMKMMSEGLQKVAGEKMRAILSAMTTNRFTGILTGVLITALIQSSSATTVMVVSFVNAGLLSLIQSIGVIMGANIGTTVTAWIISILGFKVKMSALSLPLIGLGLPFIFSKIGKRRFWGEFIIGFALLFMGLEFLKDSVPDIKQNPEILSFLSNYTHLGFGSVLIFLFIGTLLTIVIQSSSATMALTLVMCNNGWISFDLAAAMVLGENIGTTITANLAAAVANSTAKKAARAHLIFNIFGVVWMLIMFRLFLHGIDYLVSDVIGLDSPYQVATAIPIALSLFHTSFNVINVLVMFWLVPVIVKTVNWMVKQKDSDEEFRLKYIATGLLSTSELSLVQAKSEITLYAERVHKMFKIVRKLYDIKDERDFSKQYSRIEKYETICDNLEVEIATYLTQVSEGKMTQASTIKLRSMMRIISDIESIADSNFNLAKTVLRKKEGKVKFDEDIEKEIFMMFDLVEKALKKMEENLAVTDSKDININDALNIEHEINNYRDQLKIQHLEYIKTKRYKYKAGVIFMDLVTGSEKMGDSIINVSEALVDKK
ncbi:Na/Pi cotransporter family protein [Saccharicrinis sp. FJH2]|uniref:Na/Pi cotransporter family protein n=1 Tax=Saccharicrinis sp. FJH65 TaxID=3344659 RepID=UPI0035F4428A